MPRCTPVVAPRTSRRVSFVWPVLLALQATAVALPFSSNAASHSRNVQPTGFTRAARGPASIAPKVPTLAPAADKPLCFEPNRGQTDGQVRFLAHGKGSTVFLTPEETVLRLSLSSPARPQAAERRNSSSVRSAAKQSSTAVLRMRLNGARKETDLRGVEPLRGTANYLIGRDPSRWHTAIPTFGKVRRNAIYPGIDAVYYGSQAGLEYDFIVAPGADPNAIRLSFQGADRLEVDRRGDLLLHVGKAVVRQHRPVLYQEIDGTRRKVSGAYRLAGNAASGHQEIRFEVGPYSRQRPLVIDPILNFTTYLGGESGPHPELGGEDSGNAIATDATGHLFCVVGDTLSSDYPTGGVFGAHDSTLGASWDAVVTVFLSGSLITPSGGPLYSTYLGGSNVDLAYAVAFGEDGEAYVTGATASPDFPIAGQPLQSHIGPGSGISNAFVTRLNEFGTGLIYSTFLGGSGPDDQGTGIALNADGEAFVCGLTNAWDFPTTSDAFQRTYQGGFSDLFFSKMNRTGSVLQYSTYLGGPGEDGNSRFRFQDLPRITLDASGAAYICSTTTGDFPTTAGAYQESYQGGESDAILVKLNPARGQGAMRYSTYLGSPGRDGARGVALRPDFFNWPQGFPDKVFITGYTDSGAFPVSGGALQPVAGGGFDAFVTGLNIALPGAAGLVYSTYLGGDGNENYADSVNFSDYNGGGIALDWWGKIYVTGWTSSDRFLATRPVQATLRGGLDFFLTKLVPGQVVYSTYLGGSGHDVPFGVAVDVFGRPHLAGWSNSTDFPAGTQAPFQPLRKGPRDAVVAKLAVSYPPPPTGFTAKAIGSTRIQVNWNAPTGDVSSFRLERQPAGGFYTLVASPAIPLTAFVDTGLRANETYAYRLGGVNVEGWSLSSASAGAITLARPDMLALARPAVGGVRPTVELRWRENSLNLERNFRVERAPAGTTTFAPLAIVPPTVNTYIDGTVRANTSYLYRVFAIRGEESVSDPSPALSVVVPR